MPHPGHGERHVGIRGTRCVGQRGRPVKAIAAHDVSRRVKVAYLGSCRNLGRNDVSL